jgi:hypothetical protein
MLRLRMVHDNTYLTRSTHNNLSRVVNRFGRIPLLVRKEIPDSIPGTSVDRSMVPYPVSLLLSTTEVVGISQASVNSGLLGLPGPYHRYAIGTFNTCSRGSTHRALTDTGGGYNHVRAPPSLQFNQTQHSL